MAGFCGIIGEPEHSIEEMSENLFFHNDEKKFEYNDENLEVGQVIFPNSLKEQSPFLDNDILVWTWGYVRGYKKNGGYFPKQKNTSNSKFIYNLYKKYDLKFLKKLTGNFGIVLYDNNKQKIFIITDKLGSYPIFYTKDKDGNLIFSTNIQALAFHPSVNITLQKKYLYQFFISERTFGVKTPLNGIEEIHPGSVLKYDINSKSIQNEIYWTPNYAPISRSYSSIIKGFIKLFKSIINEMVDEEKSHGIYLSGGSDSRLILATIKDIYPDLDVLCFHMNERMNKEARIAKKVAEKCDCEFRFLKREEDYLKKVLENFSSIFCFNGWFDQAHGLGFTDKIRKEVDVVFNGLNAGTILQRSHSPRKSIEIPIINENLYLPTLPDFKSTEDFIEKYMMKGGAISRDGNIPDFLKSTTEREIIDYLKSGVKSSSDFIQFQGVKYPSKESFLHAFPFYPLTNDQGFIAYHSEINSMATEFPFMDSRIVEFSLTLPNQVLFRKDIVNSALKNVNPKLAKIKHANIGLPLKYPWIFQYLGKQYNMAKTNLFPSQKWEGPWGNTAQIIRKTDFVEEKIFQNKNLIKDIDFLDWDRIVRCYDRHIEGENNTNQLFSLLTFLQNSIVQGLQTR